MLYYRKNFNTWRRLLANFKNVQSILGDRVSSSSPQSKLMFLDAFLNFCNMSSDYTSKIKSYEENFNICICNFCWNRSEWIEFNVFKFTRKIYQISEYHILNFVKFKIVGIGFNFAKSWIKSVIRAAEITIWTIYHLLKFDCSFISYDGT